MENLEKIKLIKSALNKDYGSVLNQTLDTTNFLVDNQTMEFIRKAVRYELHVDINATDASVDYQTALDTVSNNLTQGYSHPIISLLRKALVLKQILPNLNYTSNVYDELFGLALYMYQTYLGMESTENFEGYKIIALISNYGFKPVLASDFKAIELGQFLNKYVVENDLANIVGLTRTDGLANNYKDYMPLIIAQFQRENNLVVTGKLDTVPEFSDNDSIVKPLAEALYLRGYTTQIPQEYFDYNHYHQAIEAFQKSNLSEVNQNYMTSNQIKTLLSGELPNTINSLVVKQAHQDLMNQLFNKDFELEWDESQDFGTVDVVVGTTVVHLHASVIEDLDSTFDIDKTKTGFSDSHHTLTAIIDDKQLKFSDTMSDADNNSAKLLFAPMKSMVAQTKMTSGRMSMTLSSDSQFMNSFDLTYSLKCAKFDKLNCSTTLSLKFKLSGTYDQLLLLLQLTAKPNAQVAYNALANGDYGIYNGFGINQEERNLDLRALTYTKPANQVDMTIKLPNDKATFPQFNIDLTNTFTNEANIKSSLIIGKIIIFILVFMITKSPSLSSASLA